MFLIKGLSLSLLGIFAVWFSGCGTAGESSTSSNIDYGEVGKDYNLIEGPVVSILDGDTLQIATNNETVDLGFIDAPEPDQMYGYESFSALASYVYGKNVQVKYDQRGQNGHIIGFVSTDENINLKMVQMGYAWVDRENCDICAYYTAEEYARINGFGLWASSNPIPPWAWRKYHEQAYNIDWSYLYNDNNCTNGNDSNTSEPAPGDPGTPPADGTYDLSACAACHGENFEKKALGVSKIVKDMTKEEVETALLGYKNGTYGGDFKELMKGQVERYTDDELRGIAQQIGK